MGTIGGRATLCFLAKEQFRDYTSCAEELTFAGRPLRLRRAVGAVLHEPFVSGTVA
jgi:hypothetical protein